MIKAIRDIEYGRAGDRRLLLDLYLPEGEGGRMPLVVWVHGGGWRNGDKGTNCRAAFLVDHGYAVASIGYRLSGEATFPAQLHDCKAAIRWLRANGGSYGIDPDRIGAWGPSAGGHLVALLGTSGDLLELEGECGTPGVSSAVTAVCDWFGPTDLSRMSEHPSHIDHDAPDSPESQLLGGPVQEMRAAVAFANPITYVTGDEPPFLIMHGDQDMTVPYEQSVLLHEALLAAGVESQLELLPGAGHGGEAFQRDATLQRVREFFDAHLVR